MQFSKKYRKQEYIPVGCVPAASVAVSGEVACLPEGVCLGAGDVCLGGVCQGGCLPGPRGNGVFAQGGCLPRDGGDCLRSVCLGGTGYAQGSVCPGGVCLGRLSAWGCLPGRVSTQRGTYLGTGSGVCRWGVCLGGHLPRIVSAQGGGVCLGWYPATPTLPVNRMTDSQVKNITFTPKFVGNPPSATERFASHCLILPVFVKAHSFCRPTSELCFY